jgi:hypothetical protein
MNSRPICILRCDAAVFDMITGKMGTGPSASLLAHKAINLYDDLSGLEKRVAAANIDHYNRKTGQCDPSLGTIARLIDVSRRTVSVRTRSTRLTWVSPIATARSGLMLT